MADEHSAAQRPECTCRERKHLENEITNLRQLVQQLDVSGERMHERIGTLEESLRDALRWMDDHALPALGDEGDGGNSLAESLHLILEASSDKKR